MDALQKSIRVRSKVNICLNISKSPVEFISFHGISDSKEHIILCFSGWEAQKSPLVRIHSECLTGDIFGSLHCDCGNQLIESCKLFELNGGVLVYLRQEGRGIGLYNKLDAYKLQATGVNTFEANNALGFEDDLRDFSVAAQMLKAVGINSIQLLSNNLKKQEALEKSGVNVIKRYSTTTYENPHNKNYLKAKAEIANHDFESKFSQISETL